MKRLLLFLLAIICHTLAHAQADSIYVWNKWCTHADTPVLFATANNLVCIHSKTIKPAGLLIKSMDNSLKIATPEIKGDTIQVMAMPYPKLSKKMRLSVSDKHTGKVLRIVNFISEEAPKPVAKLGSFSGPDIPKKDLLEQKGLRVGFLNSFYCYPYIIKQYTLKTRIAGKDLVTQVKGPMFDKEALRILETAPVGSFLLFTDIKATCPECGDRELPELRIWVR